jgi:hypothetical protein
MAADVKIDIAAEFTGKKAFKQAETSTEKLTKNVKQLAASIGLAYSGTRVLAFAKASVKAAAADEKAQQQLALALKNVGLERDAASAEAFIQRLQSEFGIVDDLLRPAYQSLAIATRDTVESQRLLNLALDVSAATGKDLGSVTSALSRAYLGNNTALTRLGVGISKADLKTKSFYDVTTQLADTFKGSATAAAATFQGSMDKLAVASANVQEIIGTGIIDALKGLGEDNSVQDLADNMQDAALYTADVIRGIGVLTEKLKALPGVGSFNVGMIPILGSYLQILRGLGKGAPAGGFPQGPPADLTRQFPSGQNSQTKIAKDTLKINKESLKLAKARAVFDLQKIQIEAALKGKLSEEDAIRLKLMKAIEEENIGNIEKYQKALDAAQLKSKELAEALAKIKASEVDNPFSKWPDYVKTAIELTNTVAQASLQAGLAAGAKLSEALSGARYAAQGAAAAAAAADAAAIAGAYGSATAATAAQAKAAQEAAAAQIAGINAATAAQAKAAQEAAAAQLATITAGSKAQQEALAAQIKAQQEALEAQGAAALAALKKRLAEEKAALDEAAAERTATVGTETLVKIIAGSAAGSAEAQAAAAAAAAIAAAEQAAQLAAINAASAAAIAAAEAAAERGPTGAPTQIAVTITGDPFTDPNAVAEKVVEIIRGAGNRGTVDVFGID